MITFVNNVKSKEGRIDVLVNNAGYGSFGAIEDISIEETRHQKELSNVRRKLAENYISKFNMTNEEIAYLIGYSDTNSFVRAFYSWTGMTIMAYKNKC